VVTEDGHVEGSGACLGCGLCLLFAGLLDSLRAGIDDADP
jgi:hypothetical protein